MTAPPNLLCDLPNYGRWLPGSSQYESTTDVDPYPVRLGSRYHDGKHNKPGKDRRGSVTGFQPPGSVDFQHTIYVKQLCTTIDVRIHYSFEADAAGTQVARWLVLDITMPLVTRPLRPWIIRSFDRENPRTMAAVKAYAETHLAEQPE